MSLYLNNESKLLILNGIAYIVNIKHNFIDEDNLNLTSSDGFSLTDSNDVYLLCKEGE